MQYASSTSKRNNCLKISSRLAVLHFILFQVRSIYANNLNSSHLSILERRSHFPCSINNHVIGIIKFSIPSSTLFHACCSSHLFCYIHSKTRTVLDGTLLAPCNFVLCVGVTKPFNAFKLTNISTYPSR